MRLHGSMIKKSWKNLLTVITVICMKISKPKETPANFTPAKIKKILVIRMDKVGDLVLSTPVFENLKKQLPGVHVTVLVRKYNSGVLKNNPYVDEVIEYDMLTKKNSLRKRGYDLAINLIFDFELESAYACYSSGAQFRAGYKAKYSKEFYNIQIEKDSASKYELLRNLDLLKSLGIKTTEFKSKLYPSAVEADKASKFIKTINNGSSALIIGLNPGTGRKRREWPPEKFIKLGKILTEQYNAKIVVMWGPADKKIAQNIVQNIGTGAYMSMAANITQLAALLSKISIFVCANTGPAHVAMAMDVPLVGLYGENDHINWTPPDKSKLRVISDKRCSDIKVEEVINGIKSFL